MESDNELTLSNLEFFGTVYVREHLGRYYIDVLGTDWWSALGFYFDHSFMRGRRDELSNEYRCFATHIINRYFQFDRSDHSIGFTSLKDKRRLFDKTELLNAVQSGSRRFRDIVSHKS